MIKQNKQKKISKKDETKNNSNPKKDINFATAYYKLREDIDKEVCNEQCNDINTCVCIARLEGVVAVYHKLKHQQIIKN